MNTCSGCTACCHTVPVKEIGLKSHTRCPHMRDWLHAKGPGCGVYESRPYSCRSWSCLYIKSDWEPDMRPDRCGFIVDEVIDLIKVNGIEYPAAQIWALAGHDDDWRHSDNLNQVMLALIDQGMTVLFRLSDGNSAMVFWKNPDTGNLERSDRHLTDNLDTLGPDSERLRRVAQMMKQRTPSAAG